MKKKKIQLIVAVVVLLVLVGGYFGLLKYNEVASAKDADKKEGEVVLDLNKDDIAKLAITNNSGSYTLAKTNGVWTLEEDPSLTLVPESVDYVISALSSVNSYYTFDPDSDISQYGLDNSDLSAVITMTDGTTHTITVGDFSTINSKYFCFIDGTTKCYMVGADITGYMGYPKTNYMSDEDAMAYSAAEASLEPSTDSSTEDSSVEEAVDMDSEVSGEADSSN